MTTQRDEEEVRRRLTVFAATVPDHGLSDFGQLVEVEAVQCECVYEVTLETEYEERTLLRKEGPTDEQTVSAAPALVFGEVNVWDTTFDGLVTTGLPGSREYEIPGSQQVGTCGRCAGHGSLRCGKCQGAGRLTCPRCSAGWAKCWACAGTGREAPKRRPFETS